MGILQFEEGGFVKYLYKISLPAPAFRCASCWAILAASLREGFQQAGPGYPGPAELKAGCGSSWFPSLSQKTRKDGARGFVLGWMRGVGVRGFPHRKGEMWGTACRGEFAS